MLFNIVDRPLDLDQLRISLLNDTAGGYVSFEGWVRNHHNGKDVTKLIYSAYEKMATQMGILIVKKALEIYNIEAARCLHRVGTLDIGDIAVWVGVTAVHRGDAFKACKYIIDEIKKDLPIWKHEYYADGTNLWTLNHHCE